MSSARPKVADQTYRVSDVARLLQIPLARLRQLQAAGEFPGPDLVLPGGGRMAERWTASRIAEGYRRFDPTAQ